MYKRELIIDFYCVFLYNKFEVSFMLFVENVSSIYLYQTGRKFWKSSYRYNNYIISYQLSGNYEHKFSSEVLRVKKDTLFFIPKTSQYSVKCVEPGEAICITFLGELDLPPTVCDCTANPEIKNLFLKAVNFKNLHSKVNYCEAASIVYSLLSFIFKSHNDEYIAHTTRSKIEKAYYYMTENYTDSSLKIVDIAEEFGMSAKYFRTVFKKLYNTTPSQYIISLRLQTAVNYLIESDLSIGEIAELSGFSDVYYFSKLFKERFAFSPKEYRGLQHKKLWDRMNAADNTINK